MKISNKRLKQISKIIEELIQTFNLESDRAMIIVGISKIDDLLTKIIEKRILPQPNLKSIRQISLERMHLSEKAEWALRLGLISERVMEVIINLYKLRNKVSHTYENFNLDDKKWTHRKFVEKILGQAKIRPQDNIESFWMSFFISWDILTPNDALMKHFEKSSEQNTFRHTFELMLLCYISALEGIAVTVRTIKPQWPYNIS